jgi:hypothetical protein
MKFSQKATKVAKSAITLVLSPTASVEPETRREEDALERALGSSGFLGSLRTGAKGLTRARRS